MRPQRIEPGPGQESVWDYPRPPKLEETNKHVQVVFNGVVIADTTHAIRVMETSQAPAYYIPPQDLRMEYFKPTQRHTYCEWKGQASYYSVEVNGKHVDGAGWYYKQPTPGFESIANYVAIYPSKMDACYVDGEKVEAMEGDFYGGWVTKDVVGPFKGGPGTWGW